MSSSSKKKLKTTTAAPKPPSANPQRVFRCPEHIGGRVVIDFRQTARKLGCHLLTPYRYLKRPEMNFPRPVQVTPHRRAFFEDEIDRWLESRPRA